MFLGLLNLITKIDIFLPPLEASGLMKSDKAAVYEMLLAL